ncbi:helix-turn-helix domain-containing protein, partial [bacterium]|nr:helix-turn-helix domain-containing protein [bacterium]
MKIWREQDWYTIPEIAEYFNMSRRAIERWGKNGIIEITTIGPRRRLISRAALKKFDATLRQAGPQLPE